jgi:hypothetical protein
MSRSAMIIVLIGVLWGCPALAKKQKEGPPVSGAEIPALNAVLEKSGWTATPSMDGIFEVGAVLDGQHESQMRGCLSVEPTHKPVAEIAAEIRTGVQGKFRKGPIGGGGDVEIVQRMWMAAPMNIYVPGLEQELSNDCREKLEKARGRGLDLTDWYVVTKVLESKIENTECGRMEGGVFLPLTSLEIEIYGAQSCTVSSLEAVPIGYGIRPVTELLDLGETDVAASEAPPAVEPIPPEAPPDVALVEAAATLAEETTQEQERASEEEAAREAAAQEAARLEAQERASEEAAARAEESSTDAGSGSERTERKRRRVKLPWFDRWTNSDQGGLLHDIETNAMTSVSMGVDYTTVVAQEAGWTAYVEGSPESPLTTFTLDELGSISWVGPRTDMHFFSGPLWGGFGAFVQAPLSSHSSWSSALSREEDGLEIQFKTGTLLGVDLGAGLQWPMYFFAPYAGWSVRAAVPYVACRSAPGSTQEVVCTDGRDLLGGYLAHGVEYGVEVIFPESSRPLGDFGVRIGGVSAVSRSPGTQSFHVDFVFTHN